MSTQVSSEVKIRPAVFPNDKEIVSRLFLAYAQSLPVKLDFQGFEEELAGLPGKYGVERGGAVFLAYTPSPSSITPSSQPKDTESIIGVVALGSFPTTTSIPTCELKRLYLAPSCRGRGVAKSLMDEVIARARELGYKKMLLDTLRSMTTARKLYSRYGFVEIGSYYASVEGAVFYKLIL
jgi:ribosomal protein S18 acetylase RimI-like enzyme